MPFTPPPAVRPIVAVTPPKLNTSNFSRAYDPEIITSVYVGKIAAGVEDEFIRKLLEVSQSSLVVLCDLLRWSPNGMEEVDLTNI